MSQPLLCVFALSNLISVDSVHQMLSVIVRRSTFAAQKVTVISLLLQLFTHISNYHLKTKMCFTF